MNNRATPQEIHNTGSATAFTRVASSKEEERVLVALTNKELNLFFGEQGIEKKLGVESRIVDFQNLGEGDWESQLQAFRPTILISAWNTPALPDYGSNASQLLPLKYVCHVSGSVRFFVPRSLIERGLIVSNWGDLASQPVAEHALLLALSALRDSRKWQPFIASDSWRRGQSSITAMHTRSLFGLSVGLHGFGHVARSLLKLLKPFGVHCFVYSEGVPADFIGEFECTACASLEELARQSDVFFECEALTEYNALSVDANVLKALPDGAVVVNVARGKLIDEMALIHEAQSGRIRVALDVYSNEPLSAADPLLQIDHGIFSPHIAGPTNDWLPRCGENALENVCRYLKGEPPLNVITLDMYDRAT